MNFDVDVYLKAVETLAWGMELSRVPYNAYYLPLLADEEVVAFFQARNINPNILEESLRRSVLHDSGKSNNNNYLFGLGLGLSLGLGESEKGSDNQKPIHSPDAEDVILSARENALIAGHQEPCALDILAEFVIKNTNSCPRIFKKLGVNAPMFRDAGYGSSRDLGRRASSFDALFLGACASDDFSLLKDALQNPEIRTEFRKVVREAVSGKSDEELEQEAVSHQQITAADTKPQKINFDS